MNSIWSLVRNLLAAMNKAVPYYRVSSVQQGQSGLGLEAQRKSVQDFAKSNGLLIVKEFIEVESGRKNDRPVLQEALKACKKHKATLLIARLDRLARNVLFVTKLLTSKVEFIAVDMPLANKFMVQMMAVFAEYEWDQISTRTHLALQAAKRNGVKLGTYGKNVLSRKNRHEADLFAQRMAPVILKLQANGFKSLRQISAELNRLQIPTYRGVGFQWHATTVFNILHRTSAT